MSVTPDGPGAPGQPFGRTYLDGPAGVAVDGDVRQRVQQQVDDLAQRRPGRGRCGAASTPWSSSAGRGNASPRSPSSGRTAVTRPWSSAGRSSSPTRPGRTQSVRSYVARRGLEEAPIDCPDLATRLTRLVTTEPATTEYLDDTVSELRARGFAASLNHVTPLGGILKPSNGVAVPTIVPFDDYGASSTGEGDGARVAIVDTGHRRHAALATAG